MSASDRPRAGRLSAEDARLLMDIVHRRAAHLTAVAEALLAGRSVGASDASALRDAVGDELAETGVDPALGAVSEDGRR